MIGVLFCAHVVQGFQNADPLRYPSRAALRRRIDSSLHETTDDNTDGGTARSAGFSRRQALGAITTAAAVMLPAAPSFAGKAELDSSTGQLFSPRPEMLSGGSTAARGGLPVSSRERLKAGETVQSVYETRFVTYLSRFLLNYDPSAQAWWLQQGLGNSWEQSLDDNTSTKGADAAFAEFAESVEVGLADYFSGPYGSYSSLSAATAGLSASQAAKSARPDNSAGGIIGRIFRSTPKEKMSTGKKKPKVDDIGLLLAKQGVLNLYTLLKARYTSESAKRQLAILFSFVSTPGLQPVQEIKSLLGEVDNATVTKLELLKPPTRQDSFRMSSRRGGGYAVGEFPQVTIDAPPPLGDLYPAAQVRLVMKPTTRVLRITVLDGGEGYTTAPQVKVLQRLQRRVCQATAVLDRKGRVESIIVLDPGLGYGKETGEYVPNVKIEAPSSKDGRKAVAMAEMEYEISQVSLAGGGCGYVSTEPPSIRISPPKQDPDWFLNTRQDPETRAFPQEADDSFQIQARVCEMRFPDKTIAFSGDTPTRFSSPIDDALLEQLARDPLELLPSSVRPELRIESKKNLQVYTIPALASIPQFVAVLPPRYRACDPIFGGIGRVPVTRGAAALRADEYARLALSGAVCTVLVRTALNPLELIKTKQQLLNDDELLAYARKRKVKKAKVAQVDESKALAPASGKPTSVGTIDLVQSTVELRGTLSLFQSADITFLASLVFGSFGFGATELFRRSFTEALNAGGGEGKAGFILLLAAAVATVVTAAAASPFEVLRVRSMGLVESKKWTSVLEDFLVRTD